MLEELPQMFELVWPGQPVGVGLVFGTVATGDSTDPGDIFKVRSAYARRVYFNGLHHDDRAIRQSQCIAHRFDVEFYSYYNLIEMYLIA